MEFETLKKEDIVKYCQKKTFATSDFPFDDEVMVFRIFNKIFALINVKSKNCNVSLKCNPELAEILREEYNGVTPGYHLNKKHWNSIDCESGIPDKKIEEMIDHSYMMVVKGLKKEYRDKLS